MHYDSTAVELVATTTHSQFFIKSDVLVFEFIKIILLLIETNLL